MRQWRSRLVLASIIGLVVSTLSEKDFFFDRNKIELTSCTKVYESGDFACIEGMRGENAVSIISAHEQSWLTSPSSELVKVAPFARLNVKTA